MADVLERAAELYVTPRFERALATASAHHQHLTWLLLSCAIGFVSPSRFVSAIASAYHLLQAHLTRVQKLSLSRSLRRISSPSHPSLSALEKCRVLHLAVRLGMFTESKEELMALHSAATRAMAGIAATAAEKSTRLPTADGAAEEAMSVEGAAAHYTLAGFYTYHHRRDDLGETLALACHHLNAALRMQRSLLGAESVPTLCSELVRAQVLLLRNRNAELHECRELLEAQLAICERLLSLRHPLAAKMLAVKARLCQKMRRDDECEELQQRVLAMRQAALGMDHEDTHRSAMDVYARRRQVAFGRQHEPLSSPIFQSFATALTTCLEMVTRAAAMPGEGFALSKSLQGMAALCFEDVIVMSKAGVWPREIAVQLLQSAAQTARRLPHSSPFYTRQSNDVLAVKLAGLADELAASPTWPPREWPFNHGHHHSPGPVLPAQALPTAATQPIQQPGFVAIGLVDPWPVPQQLPQPQLSPGAGDDTTGATEPDE